MGYGILLVQLIIFIPAIALLVLNIYFLILAIRALKIYISKNS